MDGLIANGSINHSLSDEEAGQGQEVILCPVWPLPSSLKRLTPRGLKKEVIYGLKPLSRVNPVNANERKGKRDEENAGVLERPSFAPPAFNLSKESRKKMALKTNEPTLRCHQIPLIGALWIQEPVILGEPQIHPTIASQ